VQPGCLCVKEEENDYGTKTVQMPRAAQMTRELYKLSTSSTHATSIATYGLSPEKAEEEVMDVMVVPVQDSTGASIAGKEASREDEEEEWAASGGESSVDEELT